MKDIFPEKIPIFPLSGVIYFPKTNLPLNIFEKRYLDLVNDAMKKNKLMGMVQSQRDEKDIYQIGCLGKISDFQKSKDGRILINLTGLTRFKILQEIENKKPYREFEVEYGDFKVDFEITNKTFDNKINSLSFVEKTRTFFKRSGLLLNWQEFEKLDFDQQINTLAMIAPVTNEEKQKMLETVTIEDKTKTLLKIIEFYLHDSSSGRDTIQ